MDLSSVDISGVEKVLISIHSHVAAIAKTPELEIDGDEAHKLAKAGLDVYKHYATYFPTVTEKTVDVLAVLYVVGSIYGTRFAAIKVRKVMEAEVAKARAKEAVNPASKPVVPPGFNPPERATFQN